MRRSFKIIQHPTSKTPGVLTITTNGKSDEYRFCIFGVSPSMGQLGVRFDPKKKKKNRSKKLPLAFPYDCLLRHDKNVECDCKGFTSWGHCKHADLVPVLLTKVRLEAK